MIELGQANGEEVVWDSEIHRVYKIPLSAITISASNGWHAVEDCQR